MKKHTLITIAVFIFLSVFCKKNSLNNDNGRQTVNARVTGSVEIQSIAAGSDGTSTGEIIRLNDLDSILVRLGYDDLGCDWTYTRDGQFEFQIKDFDENWYWLDAVICWAVHKGSSIENRIGTIFGTAIYSERIILPPDNEGTEKFMPYIGPYPNPFTTSVKFRYALTDTVHEVTMRIWNYRDKKFAEFTRLDSIPDTYEVEWNWMDQDGLDSPPGVYIAYFECRDYRYAWHNFYQTVVKE